APPPVCPHGPARTRRSRRQAAPGSAMWPTPAAASWPGSVGLQRAVFDLDRHVTKVAFLAAAHAAHELATRSVDIITAGTPYRGAQAALVQDILKALDALAVRPCIGRAGMRIERNQVDLGRALPQQLDQFPRLFGLIVNP